MAWTTPKDWEDNELVTAQMLNEQLKDNLTYLHEELPTAKVSKSSFAVVSGTTTILSFDAEDYDNDGMFDSGTPAQLTCKTAGTYLVVAKASFDANATGIRQVEAKLVGVTVIASEIVASAGSSSATKLNAVAIYQLAVNDRIEMRVYQNAGSALNVTGDLSLVRIG